MEMCHGLLSVRQRLELDVRESRASAVDLFNPHIHHLSEGREEVCEVLLRDVRMQVLHTDLGRDFNISRHLGG